MAAAKSKAIEKDVDGLISSITGFSESLEEDQENFDLCRRYVLSNIYYHRYLDTSSHEVRRQLHGLATKFRVHALPGHADRLETLWKRLVETGDWAEHSQYDIEWRLLSLLVNLSHNPTSAASLPRPADPPLAPVSEERPQEQEQAVDWRQELRLEEGELSPYQSPEEWSDLDDDNALQLSPPPVHVVRFSRPSLLLPGAGISVSRSAGGRCLPPSEEGDPLSWLEERISRPHQPAEPGPGPLRPAPDAAEMYHGLQVRLGLSGPGDLSVLPEWCVCRELVWQLLSPADSPLLQCRDGRYRPTGRYRVHGLTQAALSSLLARLCAPITAASRLRSFVRSPGPLSTHRAFAASLSRHLRGLDQLLVALETELQRQEVTLTLGGLQRRLSAWTGHLSHLDQLLDRGVLSGPADRPPWLQTARLVSVLYESVEVCSDQRWSPALVRLFLDTVQPLLAVVHGWTVLETEPDPRSEFIIQRNAEIPVTDPQYWERGFTVHSSSDRWWPDGVKPLPFLLPHLDRLVQTAKCLRILCHLRLTDDLDDVSLQDEFNRLVAESLSKAAETPLESEAASADAVPTPEVVPARIFSETADITPSERSLRSPNLPDIASQENPAADGTRLSGDISEKSPKGSEETAADPLTEVRDKATPPGAAISDEQQPSADATSEPATASDPAPAAVQSDTGGTPADPPAEPGRALPGGAPVDVPGRAGAPEDVSEHPGGGASEPAGAPVDRTAHPEGAPADPAGVSAHPAGSPEGTEGAPADAEAAASEADSGRGSEGALSPPPAGMLRELLAACGSPYLSAAFQEALRAADGEQESQDTQEDRSAPGVRLTTCLPHTVCWALSAPLSSRHSAVCRRLVTALKAEFRLTEHLRMLRRVFLMEAGDLMAQFTQQLCDTLSLATTSDQSVSLTLCLEDCLSARHPDHAARLSVTLPPPENPRSPLLRRLETVTLGYSVPWPCSLVITEACVGRYNEMFRFILQVKVTLRALQMLRFEDLSRSGAEADTSGASLDLEEPPPVPRASRVLRAQLLRAWLLHFVGSIHSYLMMRVLHSTSLELERRLEEAADVDSMVQTHELYLSLLLGRCLLSGAAERTLHAAVFSALQLSARLQLLWTAGQLPEQQLLQLEADYVRCHHFTAGLLRQYRQTTGHVDGLAAAMAHSAPGQISYDELV